MAREEKISGDRFVAYHGDEKIGEAKTRGVMLSKLQTFVCRTKEDNAGTVRFEPVLGPSATVFLVRKIDKVVYTTTINDIND